MCREFKRRDEELVEGIRNRDEKRKRECVSFLLIVSIISPLFHYWSGSEGWGQVGQFPQIPSGCPWKWQITRLIVSGSGPFGGNEPLYLEQKSIKGVHSQSTLSVLRSSEGWPRPTGKDREPSPVSTVDIVCDRNLEIKFNFLSLGPLQQYFQVSCLREKDILFLSNYHPWDQLHFIFHWYKWSTGDLH